MKRKLANWIAEQKQGVHTLVVGISGAQGTGKSTLAHQLQDILSEKYAVACLSMDDLYLNQDNRRGLAQNIHPLFQTRGVPTTHDVALGIHTLMQLKGGQGEVLLPRFDKQTDNPKPHSEWEVYQNPVDIVLFEGWCLGMQAQGDADLAEPMNVLEAEEDKGGVWRKQANAALKGEYQTLFAMVDRLIYLQPPSFEAVFDWRKQQEVETFIHHPEQGMNDAELTRFMAHFERLTRHGLTTLPQQADVVICLGEQHQWLDVLYRN